MSRAPTAKALPTTVGLSLRDALAEAEQMTKEAAEDAADQNSFFEMFGMERDVPPYSQRHYAEWKKAVADWKADKTVTLQVAMAKASRAATPSSITNA